MRVGCDLKLYLILIVFIKYARGLCVNNACLEDMTEDEAKKQFDYVLSKYEEIEMKILGKPIGLRGKRITHGELTEEHIVFNYIDNTAFDIMQNCAFIISNLPGACESIITACNSYYARTPRPLLQRKPLEVCEDGVREAEVEVETEENTTTEPEAEVITNINLTAAEKNNS